MLSNAEPRLETTKVKLTPNCCSITEPITIEMQLKHTTPQQSPTRCHIDASFIVDSAHIGRVLPLSTQDIEVPASESVAVTLSLPALSESKGFFAPRRCFNTLSPTISCVYCYFLLVYRWFVCHLIEIQEHEWMNVGVLQITVTREKSAMTEDVKGNDGVVTDSNITLKSSSTTPLPKWLELPPGVLGQLRIVTQISKLSTGELQRMSFNPSR